MAAILCKPISACFEFVCTAPCKLCSGGCKLCSDGLSGLCTNPLGAFIVVTYLTQIPLAIAAAWEIPGLLSCRASQWLVGMLVAAIAHMFTSVYLASRVTNKTDEALRDRHTSWERISYLLCHDPWIAIYLLIVLFFVVWLIMGVSWSLGGKFGGCEFGNNVSIVMGLGWFYLFAGPTVLSCNLCCACCDKGDYAGDDADFAQKDAEKEAKRQSSSAASKTNNNKNYEYASTDIETPVEPMQKQQAAPRTYSADGIPIPDNGEPVVMEAEVVIEGDDLPPPMSPPTKKDGVSSFDKTAEAAKVKAGEAAQMAQATAGKAVKSAQGWFNKNKKKNKGSDLPQQKPTLY